MRLPNLNQSLSPWPEFVLDRWRSTAARVSDAGKNAGRSSSFDQMVRLIREMLRGGSARGLDAVISTRAGARALCWMWLEDADARRLLLTPTVMDRVVELQSPRLSRMSLLFLTSLYFKEFDRLDEANRSKGTREHLQLILLDQLEKLPAFESVGNSVDPLRTLQQDGHWLLELDGPLQLASRTSGAGQELGEAIHRLGLRGMDAGRYGDICRAHFYLSTLKELRPGEWHPVMDELLKPSIAKAPYKSSARIGHAALSILIDRANSDPGERWQSFILGLAGDPRISSHARGYQEWWRPLGEARIQKVRSWLHKEDLRLFLQALEEYGNESGKADLQRMFPARKTFLEGLESLGLIRNSRLMLGRSAQSVVRRILGKDMLTSYAHLSGGMSDKAVIYLDCGDFCLVEGSHSFKIWVYLEPPSERLLNYDITEFSHADLTVGVPRDYGQQFPDYYYCDVIHHGPWQWKVFNFLADNGIELDIEQLLTREDYRQLLRDQGRPVVQPSAVRARQIRLSHRTQTRYYGEAPDILAGEVSAPAVASLDARSATATAQLTPPRPPANTHERPAPNLVNRPRRTASIQFPHHREAFAELSAEERQILEYVHQNPLERAKEIAAILDIDKQTLNRLLHGKLSAFVDYDEDFCWRLTDAAAAEMDRRET